MHMYCINDSINITSDPHVPTPSPASDVPRSQHILIPKRKWDSNPPQIRRAIVSHCSTKMPMMECPTKRFCFVVGRIYDTRNVMHLDFTIVLPFLNCKVLNINVMRSSSQFGIINHINRCLIIFINNSRF